MCREEGGASRKSTTCAQIGPMGTIDEALSLVSFTDAAVGLDRWNRIVLWWLLPTPTLAVLDHCWTVRT